MYQNSYAENGTTEQKIIAPKGKSICTATINDLDGDDDEDAEDDNMFYGHYAITALQFFTIN